jgi:hypothetical protein
MRSYDQRSEPDRWRTVTGEWLWTIRVATSGDRVDTPNDLGLPNGSFVILTAAHLRETMETYIPWEFGPRCVR